jgi:hypothetical protein
MSALGQKQTWRPNLDVRFTPNRTLIAGAGMSAKCQERTNKVAGAFD